MFCRRTHLCLIGLCCSLIFLGAGCGKQEPGVSPRLAILPFENLATGVSEDWVGPALSSILAAQTSSRAVANLRNAQLERAPQTVQGFFTGAPGDLQATAVIRDESTQKTIRTVIAQGESALAVASELARQIASQPKAYGSSNSEAVKQLFSGNPEAAVAADPNFGAAHVARVESLIRGGRKQEIPAAIEAARSANLTEIDRARLQVLTADTQKARAVSLLALARAEQHDLQIWRAAAEAALVSKDHAAAVEAYRKVLETDSENAEFWNTLAYAQAFSGDLEGAKRSLAEYRRIQPANPNALDSLGEIHFFHGKFAEAEQYFVQAFDMQNGFLGGGDLYRAALSRFLAGDAAQADAFAGRYFEFRRTHKDPLVPLREAVWLYTTGRRDEARAKAAAAGTPAARAQLAIWDLAEGKGNASVIGDRPEVRGWRLLFERRYPEAVEYWRQVYDAAPLTASNESKVLLAWALNGANRRGEAEQLLDKWPLPPAGPEPGLGSLAMAKAIEFKVGGR